jgi:nicotinamidase-related amidase
MTACLILVDLQNDYFPGGRMELAGIGAAAAKAQALLQRFRGHAAPVIHVQHISTRPGATFFLPGTAGVNLHAAVTPQAGEPVVVKHFPNCFRGTPLLDLLTGLKPAEIVIAGAMSHMCIDATTRAAFDLGFQCVVAADACATRDLTFQGRTVRAADVHASFMAALSAVYAEVISTTEVIERMV